MPHQTKFSKQRIVLFLSLLSFLFGTTGSVIYARSETSVTNHLSTGIVDIELEDYADIPDLVLPGMELPGVKEVINEGNDCYIRAKLTFPDAAVPMDNSLWLCDGWEYHADGYYYYPEIIKTGDTVDLITGFTIPKNYPQDQAGKSITLDIDVDAIQSLHFTPDFTADAPWGNIVIEQCLHENGYDISTFRTTSENTFSVTYERNTQDLFTNQDDFFTNLPTLLPGDIYTDTATLQNHSNDDILLYFWSEAKSSKLLDATQLTCSLNGTVFYEGPLSGTFQEQTVIPANTNADLTYTITVPEELQNEYTILQDQVRWIFSTEPIEQSAADQTVVSPRTGVADIVGLTLIVIGLSSGFLAVLIKVRAEQETTETPFL